MKRRVLLRLLLAPVALALGLFVYAQQFHPELEDVPGQRAQLSQRTPANAPPRIDAREVLADVRTLAAPEMQGRAFGTPGGKRARAHLARRFAQIGLEPAFADGYEQPFSAPQRRGIRFWRAKFWQPGPPIQGANLAGMVRGTVEPQRWLVVSAHYDHLGMHRGRLHPGADDNASGVAAMLAAARWFRAHPPRHSIVFVAFDGEEDGLLGALAFVAQPPLPFEALLLNLNFDMISRNPDNEIYVSGLYANPQLAPIVHSVRLQARPTLLFGHDHPRPFWDFEDWTHQSDQGPFAARGVPFLYLGVADHPDYHAPGDTFEKIDREFYLGVVDSALELLLALDAADAAQLRRTD